jgi:hypothetical protein
MRPLSRKLGNFLLARHREICLKFTGAPNAVSEGLIEQSIITCKALLDAVGSPEVSARSIGRYLQELAEWSETKNVPPITALAVAAKFGMPGLGYYEAPGCGRWRDDVRECIACKRYPDSISED